MNRQKLANMFLLAALFLLPWQTVWLYRIIALPEGATVYGNLGVYVTEILIVLAFLLRGRPMVAAPFQKIMRALYFFLAACFFSLAWSRVFSVSLGFVSHVMVAGMLFLLLVDMRTNILHMMHAFVLGLILPCLLGWFQFVYGSSPASTVLGLSEKHVLTAGIAVVATNTFRSVGAYGTFPHPNIFGGYLAFAIVLIGWLAHLRTPHPSQGGGRGVVALKMCLIVLFTSTLILTFSRGAWLALSIALVAILAQAFAYKKLIPHRAIPLISVGLLTLLLAVSMLHTHIFARFNPALHVEAISIEERASQYQTFFHVLPPLTKGRVGVGSAEWLVGVGPGAYVFELAALSKGQPAYAYQPIHNAFLLMLAELGIVGFVAFGYFVFEMLRLIFKHKKTTGGIFAVACILELLILAMIDHYPFSFWPGLALSTFILSISLRFANESHETLHPTT